MIRVLEDAIEKVKPLPKERQECAAELPEQIVAGGEDGVYAPSHEERWRVREGLDELDRGEAASEADVRGVFDNCRTRGSSARGGRCAIATKFWPTSKTQSL